MYERTDDKRQTMAASGAPRNPAAILHRSSSVPHPLSSVVRRQSFAEFGAPVSEMKPEEFAQYGMIFQIGVAPCRVDIISKISGVSYADAVTRAVPKTIDGIPVRIISLEDLIANKKASGRAKDLADVEVLEGCRK